MANSIAYTKNYTAVLDEVYKRAACSTCLNSPRRMARAGRNARYIMVPKIEVAGLGDYTRNAGYKTGSITYEFEAKTFNYNRGIKLLAAKKSFYANEQNGPILRSSPRARCRRQSSAYSPPSTCEWSFSSTSVLICGMRSSGSSGMISLPSGGEASVRPSATSSRG